MTRTTLRAAGLVSAVVAVGGLGALAIGQQERPQQPPEVGLAAQLSEAFTHVALQVTPSVVYIEVEKPGPDPAERLRSPFGPGNPFGEEGEDFFRRFFPDRFAPGQQQVPQPPMRGQGSGFIVSEDGTILTNAHVVADASEITVHLVDGREVPATVVGADPKSDVAVIRLNEEDAVGLDPLPLGSSRDLKQGAWSIAVGNPFGLTSTVTVGVISATGRNHVGITEYEDFIQTDAAVNPGNSGGPLVDLNGRAVGINTAIFSQTGGFAGIGFAIPIDMVKAIMKQLIERGEVVRGYLGVMIQEIDQDLADSLDLSNTNGALVSQVSPDSPAAQAGLEVGDVIVALEGREVGGVGELRNRVSMTQPGKQVRLTVLRAGARQELQVTIGELPDEAGVLPGQPSTPGEQPQEGAELGLAVQPLDAQTAEQLGFDPDTSGVLIREVFPNSPAAKAGLQPGSVITRVGGQELQDVEGFKSAVAQAKQDGRVLLLVASPDGAARFVVLELGGR